MPSPLVAFTLSVFISCQTASSQYSVDQCSWRGSGLTHEGHTRDVEQVYLRCSQGSLEWLYPTGAIIVNLRPNTASRASSRLSVCIKPYQESSGSNIYLDKAGKLRLLLPEKDQALGKVHCFGIQEGSIFIEAVLQLDISRKITSFQYELISDLPGANPLSASCQPCSDSDVLLAVCTSDFVARGRIVGVSEEDEHSSVTVMLSRLHRQKSQVFVFGGGRVKRWSGKVKVPHQCGVKPGEGELLFTGTVRFGEPWLGCTPRYVDFLRVYREAQRDGTNPCNMDTD
ncbi:meteorin-like protein [Denticeps clupeoides]|uniref:Meteorin-like protein n=1 Tax=Denticeps clupeoides TaxID=299321 RepID=A0AAY4BJJ2_9TELE|nr:meteorin-like protein [Denticeps clupeoides]